MWRSFFQDGLKTADKLRQYIDKLAADLFNVRRWYDRLRSAPCCPSEATRLTCAVSSDQAESGRGEEAAGGPQGPHQERHPAGPEGGTTPGVNPELRGAGHVGVVTAKTKTSPCRADL